MYHTNLPTSGQMGSFSQWERSPLAFRCLSEKHGICFKNHHHSEKIKNDLFICFDYGCNFSAISFSGKTSADMREPRSISGPIAPDLIPDVPLGLPESRLGVSSYSSHFEAGSILVLEEGAIL